MSNVEEVVPELYKIELPLPIPGLDNVFVYLFKSGSQSLLVDTGWNDEGAYEKLIEAFSSINFKASDLKSIVLSHLHPDHVGLASRLKKEAPDVKVMLHQRDAAHIVYSPETFAALAERMHMFLRMNGTPQKELDEMSQNAGSFEKLFSGMVRPDRLLQGGEILPAGRWNLEVIATPGHTPGNICLFDHSSSILFSGDHVLPKITPNVSLSPLHEGDPLGDYMRSLRELKKFDPWRILPSHEYVFEHLESRIEEIEKHHEQRLAEVLRVLGAAKEEISGYQVARALTWSIGFFDELSSWQKGVAVGEALSHLKYLEKNNMVLELREGTEPNETLRYSKIAS